MKHYANKIIINDEDNDGNYSVFLKDELNKIIIRLLEIKNNYKNGDIVDQSSGICGNVISVIGEKSGEWLSHCFKTFGMDLKYPVEGDRTTYLLAMTDYAMWDESHAVYGDNAKKRIRLLDQLIDYTENEIGSIILLASKSDEMKKLITRRESMLAESDGVNKKIEKYKQKGAQLISSISKIEEELSKIKFSIVTRYGNDGDIIKYHLNYEGKGDTEKAESRRYFENLGFEYFSDFPETKQVCLSFCAMDGFDNINMVYQSITKIIPYYQEISNGIDFAIYVNDWRLGGSTLLRLKYKNDIWKLSLWNGDDITSGSLLINVLQYLKQQSEVVS